MRKSKRLVSLVGAFGVAIVAAGSLAGCGTQVTGNTGSDADTLTYWSGWSEGEPQQVLFQSIIDDFEEESGVEVDVRWLGRDYVSVVNNANAVGKGPDLFDDATDHIAEFRSKDAIGDVSGVLDMTIPGEDRKVSDVLSASVIDASSDADGLGLIPYSLITTSVWFDSAAHPEWETAPPATFDDFLAVASDLKADGEVPIAQDGTINFYNAYWFYWLMMRHGGPGSLAGLAESADNWDSPAVLAAAEDVQRLADADLFQPSFMGTKYPAAQNDWAQGKAAFALNGSWLASEVAPNQKDGFAPTTFQFPQVADGFDSVEAGTLGWSINAKAKNADSAAEFLAFALQKKYMEGISSEALNIPSRSDIPAPDFLVAAQEAVVNATVINKTYDEAPALYAAWWSDSLLPLDDKLLSGEITAQQFVEQGKAATVAYLATK